MISLRLSSYKEEKYFGRSLAECLINGLSATGIISRFFAIRDGLTLNYPRKKTRDDWTRLLVYCDPEFKTWSKWTLTHDAAWKDELKTQKRFRERWPSSIEGLMTKQMYFRWDAFAKRKEERK